MVNTKREKKTHLEASPSIKLPRDLVLLLRFILDSRDAEPPRQKNKVPSNKAAIAPQVKPKAIRPR
jgi:hypothetical protein